jgi:hypothetical protein
VPEGGKAREAGGAGNERSPNSVSPMPIRARGLLPATKPGDAEGDVVEHAATCRMTTKLAKLTVTGVEIALIRPPPSQLDSVACSSPPRLTPWKGESGKHVLESGKTREDGGDWTGGGGGGEARSGCRGQRAMERVSSQGPRCSGCHFLWKWLSPGDTDG